LSRAISASSFGDQAVAIGHQLLEHVDIVRHGVGVCITPLTIGHEQR